MAELVKLTNQPELPTPHELQENNELTDPPEQDEAFNSRTFTEQEPAPARQVEEINNPNNNKKKSLALRKLKRKCPKTVRDSEKSEKQKTPTITTTVELSYSDDDEMPREETTIKPKREYFDNNSNTWMIAFKTEAINPTDI